ncbi:unnamed protein product [Durusdinium trenchii]|uniref:Pentatricopeptide repeat-containing protein, chloroplastic n=1 Tax=Durusdinium trenchii TaxID=1381693 RepID=A0ABP0SY63_9DINO
MDRSSSLRDFTRSLSSAGKASKWTSCLASLETALQTALRLDAFALSAAMNACDRGGPWRWGLELQRALEERHLEVDTACVATAISSVARRHAWTGGVHLLEELRISTLPLSTTACANALRAFPHWQSALQLVFNALAQRLWPEPFLGNLLLTQMPKEASCLVQMRVLQIQLDVVSYNTMLSSCASWKDALQTFQLMSTHIQAPNSISQTCLIAACATAWRSALATTVSSSLSAHSAAAVAARRSGRWMVSLSLLTELKGRHIEGDTAAFNEEVNAQSASWSTALSRFHATGARDWGLPARDSVTVTVLLSALLKTLQWPIAMVLLEESAATGLAQDSVDDFAFLKAAVAAGEDHVVKKLLVRIPGSVTSWVSEATSISSAWSFFQAANTAAAGSLLLSRWPRWPLASAVLHELRGQGAEVDAVLAADLVRCSHSSSQWPGALELLKGMSSAELRLDVKSSNSIAASGTRRKWPFAKNCNKEEDASRLDGLRIKRASSSPRGSTSPGLGSRHWPVGSLCARCRRKWRDPHFTNRAWRIFLSPWLAILTVQRRRCHEDPPFAQEGQQVCQRTVGSGLGIC